MAIISLNIGRALLAQSLPTNSNTWIFVIVAALTIVYAIARPLMRRKDPLSKPPQFASLAQQRSVERQMQNVLVELSEMARQISAQLDTRSAKLEALIKEADEKLAALAAATSPSHGVQPVLQARKPAAPEVDPRYMEIYTLSDQGRSSLEIAQQLNRPSGEIELILALRK